MCLEMFGRHKRNKLIREEIRLRKERIDSLRSSKTFLIRKLDSARVLSEDVRFEQIRLIETSLNNIDTEMKYLTFEVSELEEKLH